MNIQDHIITPAATVKDALPLLNTLGLDAILFVVDENQKLVGSLTDGDIRRGLLKGLSIDNLVGDFIQPNPKFFRRDSFSTKEMKEWRDKGYKIVPVLNAESQIVDIVNFRLQKSYLPIDAVIMAGGKGTRLRPLTENTPKPLLKVGDKPIIEHNIDRLAQFGIRNITLSIAYLGQQLVDYFGDGATKQLNMGYVSEDEPLGTIGAVAKVQEFAHDYVLVMNSDLLTNIDFEDMFETLIESDADMVVATTPYKVEIPYGVIETEEDRIVNLREKPTYTYYSNAGIYIFKKEHVALIPEEKKHNATDLMEQLYSNGKKVMNYPILGYWLDIGKHHDFEKAQKDIDHIKF